MTTSTRPKPSPAELDDELQTLVDLELGHPRRRTTAGGRDRTDQDAVHAIAEALRDPHWDSRLLDDICDIIRDTGRQVAAPPLAVIAS
jgi:hypothetical protein